MMIHKSEFLMFLPLGIAVNVLWKTWLVLVLEKSGHTQRYSYIMWI